MTKKPHLDGLVANAAFAPWSELTGRAAQRPASPLAPAPIKNHGATCAKLHGFDLRDCPVLSQLADRPGELVPARTVVPLRRDMLGATVLVLFEDGNASRPIVAGVMQEGLAALPDPVRPATPLVCDVDGERLTLSAEREIVLRCGDASITLTRGGKVVIQGSYVLSRSTGYNKIKGAAVDIN